MLDALYLFSMKEKLQKIEKSVLIEISDAETEAMLEALRVRVLGRKGELTKELKGLKDVPVEKRKELGEMANAVKIRIENALQRRLGEMEQARYEAIADEEWIDVTAPGETVSHGSLHMVTQTMQDIEDIFARLGFSRIHAPEVDWDHYAFETLNMPASHPARDDWETFFIDVPEDKKFGKQVLRPHTSNMQVRAMKEYGVPLKVINLGRVYRRQVSARHLQMFHQFEGLCVGKDVTLADLKGTIEFFFRQFFGDREVRYRPYHFRFTEPSFEIDIACDVCDAKGCGLCKEGWLELAGAGMTHPNVLRAGGVDPDEYSAFAFGFGIERIAMMRGGVSVPDIRMLVQSDLRFLRQF